MTRVVRVVAVAAAGVCLVAAAGCGRGASVQSEPPVIETTGAEAPAYRLRPGDAVIIDFVTDNTMTLQTPVTPSGTVTLPLGGEIKASGKTVEELARDIEEYMSPYLLGPGVSVTLASVGSQPVFVIGEVRSPGRIDSAGPLTVSRAVATAGGLLPTAQPGSVMLVRTEQVDRPTAYRIDLASVLSGDDLGQDVELLPNDVVYVPQSFIGNVGEFVTLFFDSIIPAQLFYLHGYDMAHPEERWQ